MTLLGALVSKPAALSCIDLADMRERANASDVEPHPEPFAIFGAEGQFDLFVAV